jgi:hypothetical protein
METKLLLTVLASLTIALSAHADETFRALPDAWVSNNYESLHTLVHTQHHTNQYRRWRDAMIAHNQLTPITANTVLHVFHSNEGIAFIRGHDINGQPVTLYIPMEDLGVDLGTDDPTPAATPVTSEPIPNPTPVSLATPNPNPAPIAATPSPTTEETPDPYIHIHKAATPSEPIHTAAGVWQTSIGSDDLSKKTPEEIVIIAQKDAMTLHSVHPGIKETMHYGDKFGFDHHLLGDLLDLYAVKFTEAYEAQQAEAEANPETPTVEATSTPTRGRWGSDENLQVLNVTWRRDGFGAVAILTVTFKNCSDSPITNISYDTTYTAENGDVVTRGGTHEFFGVKNVKKVIQPGQTRTIEIDDGFIETEAVHMLFRVARYETR